MIRDVPIYRSRLARQVAGTALLSICVGCRLSSPVRPEAGVAGAAVTAPTAKSDRPVPELTVPTIRIPRTTQSPSLTADVNDPAWAGAATIPTLGLPFGAPASQTPLPTEVKLLWDSQWLYVRFICTGPEPYAPFGQTRDARHYQGDVAEIFLEPVGDGRQYFEVQLSPAGGVFDQNTLLTGEARSDARGRLVPQVLAKDYWPNPDYTMPELRTAASVARRGDRYVWIADFALPAAAALKRTGAKAYHPMTLRMNLLRYHHSGPVTDKTRKLLAMNWAPVTQGCPHQSPAAMGKVELIDARE